MKDKIIINFTPTGIIPKKNQTRFVPVYNHEIIDDVKKAYEAGISMVHLHVRDEVTQESCYKKEKYAQIIRGIREFAPDLIICVSTSGRICNDYDKRVEVLQLDGVLKPDMASLTLSSLNFNNQFSVNEPALIKRLGQEMLEKGIKPELEAFDVGMINYAKYLIKKGILIPPFYFNLIFGNIACSQAELLHIGLMINDLPDQSIFSLGGVGNFQHRVNSIAISIGSGVRVGLEDNIWYDSARTKLATNIELLQRVREFAKINEKEIMTSTELRALLGLKRGFGEYGVKK